MTLVLKGGRPWGSPADLLIRDGLIAEIGRDLTAEETLDLGGRLVLPGFVDAHCHLDKTLYGGPWIPNTSGTEIAEMIVNGRTRREEVGVPDPDRITALLTRMVAAGTSHVRTHTDVDPWFGLAGVEAVLAASERLAGKVHVEQVAFPQCGILAAPGTADLLEEALKLGVRAVGGLDPAGIDRDPVRHLDIVFGLADRYGAHVDFHLHDGGSLGAWQFELIIERTRALGLGGRVTIGHAFAIGEVPPEVRDRLIEGLADAGVSLTTCAIFDDPVPPAALMKAAGANLALGNDGIRDLWTPYGTGDMLERTMHLAYRSTFKTDADIRIALEAATHGGARALALPTYGLVEGAPADLVVLDARTPAEAIMTRPLRHLVLKNGTIVARDGTFVP